MTSHYRIPLRRLDGTVRAWALVDLEDAERVAAHTWHCRPARNTLYAGRRPYGGETILMHREVLGLVFGDGVCVDHIDGNGLDNRRSNLRVATYVQNGQNRRNAAPRGRSRYRNVSWRADRQVWRVQVKINRRVHYIGLFEDEEEANFAAIEARRRLFTHSEEAA